jgi:uncharacterized protein with GYD domain
MPKFLYEVQYSSEGLSGIAADGAAKRLRDVKTAIKSLGGKVEAFYFCLGDNDAIVIVELPDEPSAAAASLVVGTTGLATIQTTRLLNIGEVDQAIEKAKGARYRPRGGDG